MSDDYDYYLWQGDSDDITATLYDKDGAVNLASATSITTVLTGLSGSPRYEISCSGNSSGEVVIHVSDTETAAYGGFKLVIIVVLNGKQYTFQSINPLYIKINKAL